MTGSARGRELLVFAERARDCRGRAAVDGALKAPADAGVAENRSHHVAVTTVTRTLYSTRAHRADAEAKRRSMLLAFQDFDDAGVAVPILCVAK